MPASEVAFGISSHQGTLIDSLSIEDKIEVKQLKDSKGVVAKVHSYNPTTTGSVKGHGTTTVAVGVGDPGVTGVSGGVTVITSFKKEENHDDFDGWEYQFEHFPNATSLDTSG